ncbi:MAG TPA: hypothetical protein VHN56_00885 [Actinomycetota bacterium]|nr:hypothetical protein [Actinomycetota bacterium]
MATTLGRDVQVVGGIARVTGVAGVLALVLAETVAGAAGFTWISPLWNETKRSYFTLWSVLATLLFAWPAWFAASSGAIAGDATGGWVTGLSLAVAVLGTATAVAFLLRQPKVGLIVGIVSVPASLAVLVAMAATGRQGYAVSLFQLAAGAALLGAAYDGLFLGHWYLTDRKLTRRPIDRATLALIVATAVELVAITTSGFGGTPSSAQLNPLLTAGALAPWIAIGMAAATLLIAVVVRAALRSERASAVQSATGFYYLAVVTAFTAEIAVKTRFLPG